MIEQTTGMRLMESKNKKQTQHRTYYTAPPAASVVIIVLMLTILVKVNTSVHCEELIKDTPAGHLPGYHEKESYADVYGDGERWHYWLYNTYIDYDGDAEPLYKAIFDYFYSFGWDNIYYDIINPNPELAKSVKQLMLEMDSDVSMTERFIPYDGFEILHIYINNHDRKKGVWSTFIIIYGRDRNK